MNYKVITLTSDEEGMNYNDLIRKDRVIGFRYFIHETRNTLVAVEKGIYFTQWLNKCKLVSEEVWKQRLAEISVPGNVLGMKRIAVCPVDVKQLACILRAL